MPSMDLIYRFVGLDAGAGAEFSKMSAHADSAGASWKKFGLSSAAGAAVVAAASIKMADTFEVSRSQLESAIKNVGGNWDALSGRVKATDAAMQALGFTNADAESGLAGLTVATKNPTEAMHLMGLAADVARGRNMSLADSTALLVKVETGHVALLGRLGINTKDATGATITQQQALQRLTNLYGGDATRFSKTFSGQLDVLKAQSEDLGKNLGLILVPALIDTIHGVDAAGSAVKATANFMMAHRTATLALAGALSGALLPALAETSAAMTTSAISGFADVLARITVSSLGAERALALTAGESTGLVSALAPLGAAAAVVAGFAVAAKLASDRSKAATQQGIASADAYAASLHLNATSIASLTTGVAAYKSKMDPLTATIKQQLAAGNVLGAAQTIQASGLGELAGKAQQAASQLKTLKAQLVQQTAAATLSHRPLTQAAQDFATAASSTTTLSASITSLDSAWDLLVGNLTSSRVARATVITDEKAWKKAIDASNGSISLQTVKGQAASAALTTLTTDVHAQSDAITNSGGSWKQAQGPIKDFIKLLQASPAATTPYVRKLVAGLEHELAGLRHAGTQAGQNLDLGLIAGLQSLKGGVSSKATEVMNAATIAMHHAGHFGSPSKITIQQGKWLAEGLMDGFTGESEKLKDALAAPIQNALDHLQTIMQNALSRQQNALKAAKSALHQELATRRSDISSLSGTISSGADISGIFGTDANGNATMGNAQLFLQSQVGPLEQESAILKKLAAKHMKAGLLSEIANLPVAEAIQVGQQFLSGQSSIALADQAYAQIQKYSTSSATTVTDGLTRHAIQKDRASVEENTKALHELREELHKLASREGKEVAREINVKFDTGGRLIISHRQVQEIVAGINKAIRTGTVKLAT